MAERCTEIKQSTTKILIFTVHFDPSGTNPWLVDDLAHALVRQGCEVDVVVGEAKRTLPRGLILEEPRLRVFSIGSIHPSSRGLKQYLRHAATLFRFRTQARRLIDDRHYDACLFFSTGIMTAGLPGALRRSGVCDRLLMVMWDFFPIHQIEIGRLPRRAAILRHLEYATLRNCDTIAVMTPRNADFLRHYHPGFRGQLVEIPPWSNPGGSLLPASDPSAPLRLVFGGQLAVGRGLDTLLDAAGLLIERGCEVEILIAGHGPEGERLRARMCDEGLDNVNLVGSLSRVDYRKLLSSCDAGIAITVANVSIPSFPSKIGEYCQAGLAVLVCSEPSSDIGSIAVRAGWGVYAEAGEPEILARAVEDLSARKASGALATMQNAALAYANSELSVDHAARKILAAIGATH